MKRVRTYTSEVEFPSPSYNFKPDPQTAALFDPPNKVIPDVPRLEWAKR